MKDEAAGTRSPRPESRPFHGRSSRRLSHPAVRRSFPVLLTALFLAACSDDSTEPLSPETAEVGVVLSSIDLSLTIFEVENPGQTRTVGLGPAGSPVTMAVRGELAVVPLGFVPAVAVVDLRDATLLRTVGLPAGSGATGVAFLNDSIVLVANPSLNSVTPVNVLRGTVADSILVGRFPQAVVAAGGRAFVLNAEIETVFYSPDGPSTVSVIDGTSLQVTSTVILHGENAAAGGVGPDGRLYIVNSGSFGAADGSLSVVDLTGLTEVANHKGFGDFPGSLALGPSARAFIGSFSYGVAIWDTSLDAFIRGPSDALAPGGVGTSGLGFDEAGRLYTLTPDCQNPSTANRHDGAYAVDLTIPVGICPVIIAFTSVEHAN